MQESSKAFSYHNPHDCWRKFSVNQPRHKNRADDTCLVRPKIFCSYDSEKKLLVLFKNIVPAKVFHNNNNWQFAWFNLPFSIQNFVISFPICWFNSNLCSYGVTVNLYAHMMLTKSIYPQEMRLFQIHTTLRQAICIMFSLPP